MPKQWATAVARWQRANRTRKRTLSDGRVAPDNNEEYLLYQTLVGAWPFELDIQDEAARGRFIERIQQYVVKCLHEAKVNLELDQSRPGIRGRCHRVHLRDSHTRVSDARLPLPE